MKTIAVVTFPMSFNNDPIIYDRVHSSIKESLSDYAVITNGSQEAKEISIKFYSPELQSESKKQNNDNFELARKIAESQYNRGY
jgi:hypothetical protein